MRALVRLATTVFLIIAVLWTETQLRRLKSRGSLWPGGDGRPSVPYDGTGKGNGFVEPDPNMNYTYAPWPSTRGRKHPALSDLIPNQFNQDVPPQRLIYNDNGDGNDQNFEIIESNPPQVDGVIVVGKLSHENTDWIPNELPEWQHAIYTVDDPTVSPTIQQNKGRESNVYLQYLIDHYYDLPSTIVFLHSHRSDFPIAWHNEFVDYNNVRSVKNLQIDFVQRNGYVNLRCSLVPGCPDEVLPFRQPEDPNRHTEVAFPGAWRQIFNDSEVPEVIATPCCAQFAVSMEQVRKRPLSNYIWYHKWVMETELPDDVSGRVMEYLWHIIFGQNPVYCPDVEQCYRDVYGVTIFDEWVM